MHETIETAPENTDADIVNNSVLRAHLEGWITTLHRIDLQGFHLLEHLPRGDERTERFAKFHRRLGKAKLACVSLVAALNQIDRPKQEELTS